MDSLKTLFTFLLLITLAVQGFARVPATHAHDGEPLAEIAKSRADLIISGGTIVTMNARHEIIEDGAIAIQGQKIVMVGPRQDVLRAYTARQIVDTRGKAIIPGLINTHTHVPM